MLLIFLSLPACRAPAEGPGGDTSVEDTAGPLVLVRPEPTWSAEEVEARLQAGMSFGFPDPLHALDVFEGMFVGRSAECPHAGDYSLQESFDGCSATTGYRYAGVSYFTGSMEGDRDFLLDGDCYIIDAAGDWFIGGGELLYEESTEGDTHSWTAKVTGTWGYPDSGGWTAETPSLALFESGSSDAGVVTVSVYGGYTRPDAQLYFESLGFGGACGEEPTGAVRLRDPDGYWYRLDFGDACTGCGTLAYGDSALGEICVDLTPAAAGLAATLGPG